MACEACEHCQGLLDHHEAVMREGYSYHKRCHKCYVCSETNLCNAEVFKGVIFCSSCSQRIFQGCSTARQTKHTSRSSRRLHSPRSYRHRERPRLSEPYRIQRESGVIELARMLRSTDTDSYSEYYEQPRKINKPPAEPRRKSSPIKRRSLDKKTPGKMLQKESTEIGVTTEFTQQLLNELIGPAIEWKVANNSSREEIVAHHVKSRRRPLKVEEKKKPLWSDIRIAELGASTEIANMALRKQSRESEMPFVIKSNSRPKIGVSKSLSVLSDISDDGLEEWLDSTYRSMRRSKRPNLLERTVSSILKLPFKYFKTHILDRSSLVSVLVTSDYGCHSSTNLCERFKSIFRAEITEHHRRGVRRLYSTINRRTNTNPYKLGWLHLGTPHNCDRRSYRCKHYKKSHSYRCLRAQVMRLAGPTKSQLVVVRRRIKNVIAWPCFLKNFLNSPKYPVIKPTEECGSTQYPDGSPRKSIDVIM